MNYEDHIKLHQAKKEEDNLAYRKSIEDQKIALRLAAGEGEKIIREIIKPELEKLESAILDSGEKCEIKTISKKIRLIGAESEFEIEIILRTGISNILSFTAEPEEKLFSVSLRGENTPIDRADSKYPYSKITTEFVSQQCESFVKIAFPV